MKGKPQRGTQRGGFVMGLIVGLLLGLALALGVALYITKVPIPFVNKVPMRTAEQDAAEAAKNRNWDPNAPLAGKNPARPAPVAAAASGVVEAASAPPPRVAASAQAPAQLASAPKPGRDPAAILAGQAPKSTASAPEAFSYYVQAGAFARPEDAEQQRAKLAMLGVGARVMEREQAGRMVYRVRVGPFDARQEAEAVQGRLAASSVEANLVRVDR
ncbi:SPOR domain-containing protein [Aquincola sp. S2]|uniref:SPOR domain-containing protein n=1 Tax=Pseudaquabacterium terrae TaxID=2732868 RepID=A0ABX2ECI0_9BURK|nr:SPOR domain-containing protein [Aquabacterium terrae]NRF66346.1 SPOR domain-containing protein [Aquabacterium terrae]